MLQNTRLVFCIRYIKMVGVGGRGRLEGWKRGWVEDSTIKDECCRIRVWYSALDISRLMGWGKGNDG